MTDHFELTFANCAGGFYDAQAKGRLLHGERAAGDNAARHRQTDQRWQPVVPPNQREYSWRAEHITDLDQDLAKAIADEEPDYFLGSIVVAKTNGQMEVFDGQQRLATTIILLAAIRNYYQATNDDKRVKIIESSYVMGLELGTLEEQPKFKLSKVDHDFYLKHVLSDDPEVRAQAKPHGDSHERIKIATEIAAKHVSKYHRCVAFIFTRPSSKQLGNVSTGTRNDYLRPSS